MWLRLRQIALVARELDPVTDALREVFGLEICHRDPGVETFGLHNALLPVGNQFIEVVAPIREGTAGGRYLDRRKGDGGYMVIMQCDNHAPRKKRVEHLGIRTVIENDTPEYGLMQLHPRDTGGSFLEIDFQPGGEAPDGPWMPAGKNWKAGVRTEVVKGIAAAEIQSPDPKPLAEKWSQILELPHKADANGAPTIRLDNASIRFVPDRDGRGEGLGGLDLVAVDRARMFAAAQKRGCANGDVITIGGVRFMAV